MENSFRDSINHQELPKSISNIYRRMNNILIDIRYKSYKSYRPYYIFFFLEFIRHGNTQGAYNLFWNHGSIYDRIMTVRFDFSHEYTKEKKYRYELDVIFDYALIGIVDFLYDVFTNQLPYESSIGEYNIIPIFMIESDLYKKVRCNKSIYMRNTDDIKYFGRGYHIGANSLLHDLYTTKKFEVIGLNLYASSVWNRREIYRIRKDTSLISIRGQCGAYDADITLYHCEDLLGGRKIGVFTGPKRDKINLILNEMSVKGMNNY